MEYNKIIFSRLLSSFLWTVALQVFPLLLYILLTNFDVLHPKEWLVNSASIVFNFGTWLSLMPIHGLIFAIGYIMSLEHKKPAPLMVSRFKFCANIFTKTNLIKFFMYVSVGILVPWIYLKLNNFEMWLECRELSGSYCLNENSVFLVACGAWTAAYYFVRYDLLVEKHLEFPIIRQLKFLQIRYKFLNIFDICLISSIVPLFYYLPIYMWYRVSINQLFEFVLATTVEPMILTGLTCILRISLLWQSWLIATSFFAIMKTLDLMIQIHFTERCEFALIEQPNSNAVLLSTALGENNMPIIQHLACYDLYILAMSQKSTRWQIFTLSQPGGHPHTWNAILSESLKLIESFIHEIETICKVPEPVKPKSPVPRHIHVRDMTVRHEEIITGPVPLSPTTKLRNLVEHPAKVEVKERQKSAMDEFRMKMDTLLEKIKHNSVIHYIFGNKPDAEVCYLLSKSQPLIWVVQSIAELSANALHEDQFGIVLKDLPLIINTLLQLKYSLDKLGNIQNKFHKRDDDICMKAALKSALKRSLYRIAIAYSDYLTDLPLSSENLSCMQNFVNFKEC
ncbi:hypothetical protein RUM44_010231 [Polyplax serrata]|uniref:Nucleoporin Ndc1 n=1 Tax=Polyplax serrata TaxID=468196 RepID=A0ABR1AWQ2_POLSC